MARGRRVLVLSVATVTAAIGIAGPALAGLVNVSVGSYYFEDGSVGDGQVVITAGDQIRFTFTDGGKGTPHTAEVDELGIHSGAVGSGSSFTTGAITQPGTYVLYCKPHRNRGHVTTLVVLAGQPTTTTTQATTTTVPATTTTTTTQPTTTIQTTTTTGAATTTTSNSGTTTTTQATTTTGNSGTTTTTTLITTTIPSTAPAGAPPSPSNEPASLPGTGNIVEIEHDHGAHDHVEGDGGSSTTLVPTGLADASESILRPQGAVGEGEPWTRSVQFGLLLGLPLTVLAAGAGFRHTRRER